MVEAMTADIMQLTDTLAISLNCVCFQYQCTQLQHKQGNGKPRHTSMLVMC